jgi:hypothetical protein
VEPFCQDKREKGAEQLAEANWVTDMNYPFDFFIVLKSKITNYTKTAMG